MCGYRVIRKVLHTSFRGQEAQFLHSQGVLCIYKRRFPFASGSVDISIDNKFQFRRLFDIQHWYSVAVYEYYISFTFITVYFSCMVTSSRDALAHISANTTDVIFVPLLSSIERPQQRHKLK